MAVFLFLLRKKTFVPWIWMPVTAWCAWGMIRLLPLVMPRDPYYGPPEWSLFGYDALLVSVCLTFTGTLLVGCFIAFPRKIGWRVKSWVGGCLIAFLFPLAAWLIFTNPYSLQLLDPDGKPVAGATVYRLKRGLGSRLASVSEKSSDARGIVSYRAFRTTEIRLLIPGNTSWVTTEVEIDTPRDGFRKSNFFDSCKEIDMSWGNNLSTGFAQAFRNKAPRALQFSEGKVSGRAGWIVSDDDAKDLIPIFLHSGSQPVNKQFTELLRLQLKDKNLVSKFPSFVVQIAYDGYGILLSQEIRDTHNQAGKTNKQLEWEMRAALASQASFLEYVKDKLGVAMKAKGYSREVAINELRPLVWWARSRPADLDLEKELPLISEKLNAASATLMQHIREHPDTTANSLKEFESRLVAPEPD